MATYTTRVIRVIDSDTIQLSSGATIGLVDINALDRGTQGSLASTNYLKNLIEGELVEILETGVDLRGRTVAYVWRERDNLLVNQAIIRAEHSRGIT